MSPPDRASLPSEDRIVAREVLFILATLGTASLLVLLLQRV